MDKKFTIADIAHIYNIPVDILKKSKNLTISNYMAKIEALFIKTVTKPWLKNYRGKGK